MYLAPFVGRCQEIARDVVHFSGILGDAILCSRRWKPQLPRTHIALSSGCVARLRHVKPSWMKSTFRIYIQRKNYTSKGWLQVGNASCLPQYFFPSTGSKVLHSTGLNAPNPITTEGVLRRFMSDNLVARSSRSGNSQY